MAYSLIVRAELNLPILRGGLDGLLDLLFVVEVASSPTSKAAISVIEYRKAVMNKSGLQVKNVQE